jgi:hypothetical protein
MEDWQMIFSGITIVSIWLFNPVEDLLMLCLEVLMCQYGFFIKQIAFEALYVCVCIICICMYSLPVMYLFFSGLTIHLSSETLKEVYSCPLYAWA